MKITNAMYLISSTKVKKARRALFTLVEEIRYMALVIFMVSCTLLIRL